MFLALENSEYDQFKEFDKFKKEAEKQLEIVQNKFETTEAQFEVEKSKKETRDTDEEVKRQLDEFNRRSGEREQAFNTKQ